MHLATRHLVRAAVLCAVATASFTASAAALTVNLRSGNGSPGNPDALITRLDLATSCGVGYATPFTAAEFAAALSGPSAVVMQFPHPAWQQSLVCDPQAAWIGTDTYGTPLSALYAMEFDLGKPCCFSRVTLNFCWNADDWLGDATNPAGVYINGQPVPAIAGGSYAAETSVSVDITSLVQCGINTLHIYDRDVACAISGINFSATIDALECVTPATPASWGRVKATYR